MQLRQKQTRKTTCDTCALRAVHHFIGQTRAVVVYGAAELSAKPNTPNVNRLLHKTVEKNKYEHIRISRTTIASTTGTAATIYDTSTTVVHNKEQSEKQNAPRVPQRRGVAPLREVPDHGQADADLEHEQVALHRRSNFFKIDHTPKDSKT